MSRSSASLVAWREDAADENSDAIITALQLKAMASDLREAAALLRKLQQGDKQ